MEGRAVWFGYRAAFFNSLQLLKGRTMELDAKQLVEITNGSIRELIQWCDNAIDKLRPELRKDPTGSVKRMYKYWQNCRSAYRWQLEHNTEKRWKLILEKYHEDSSVTSDAS
jgi:hypothetical protein